ncbi:MAG: signal peptidase I [Dehalococcoidales bacterium]|nr:signal peptidase I [Dehalococcoidales bacterium]
MKINREIRETIIMIAIAAVVFIGMRFSIQTYVVNGPSMEPNYTANEWVIVNKLEYRFSEPARGDIAIVWSPIETGKRYIKRVIGLPGEWVEVRNGRVYVYTSTGETLTLEEPYIKYIALQDFPKTQVPADHFFVMGDNRNNSRDSREGWTIARKNMIGKAWLDIWPVSRWGLAPNYVLPNAAAAEAK